ncbi:hypothetical protein EHS13_20640 [Paenibacillus psychroresistens]|uniref:Uncharacterized protein n=1 Tax=Paenibacillus psychroresistens TaxID=1778678 RepID=A0A6B8RMY0_9BACL|nr:hypothetical protein [Paenibacillus psychroresistens]QGQ97124.1 hypothetical protein EHS13_20640 [Paenibacillus psychroresistens]
MRISFLLILFAFLVYTLYTNWRALNTGSDKLLLILLGTFNMILLVMYLFHLKLPFPAEWF